MFQALARYVKSRTTWRKVSVICMGLKSEHLWGELLSKMGWWTAESNPLSSSFDLVPDLEESWWALTLFLK